MTVTDPFAAAPAEEAQQPEPKSDGIVSLSQAKIDMGYKPAVAAPSDGKVVLTFKGGTGFDAPWIVIHAADLEDAHRQVSEEAALLASLMERVGKAGAHFASNGPANTGRGGNTGGASSAPQGATEAPAWAPPKPHADFVYKTGVSAKNGKTWHAWMPPEKGDSRDAKFFYPN